MRLAFAGTPEFAQRALERLHQAGFEIALVLTQPEKELIEALTVKAHPVNQGLCSGQSKHARPGVSGLR